MNSGFSPSRVKAIRDYARFANAASPISPSVMLQIADDVELLLAERDAAVARADKAETALRRIADDEVGAIELFDYADALGAKAALHLKSVIDGTRSIARAALGEEPAS